MSTSGLDPDRGVGASAVRPPYVHPSGLCESADIGSGTRIWAFAHVMEGATIGRDCNIGEQCFIERGARIGSGVTVKNGVAVWDRVVIEDDVFVGPYAVFTNDLRPRAWTKKDREDLLPTIVRRGATLGANCTIVCGTTIGVYAFVAAGATVVRDVPDHALAMGTPATAKGWVCRCGGTLRSNLTCSCGELYENAPNGGVRRTAST
jgi:UDP-2-acetamido-3-amino-2,3-dideoxy-glucuronate N-acetyltransferase